MIQENAKPATPVQHFVHQPLPLDRIICGDNCEVMRTLPSESIDLVVTSPPYDNLRTYSAGKPMSDLWDFDGVSQQLWRVIKPGGVVVWVVNDATVNGSETGTSFRQALRFMEIGFRLHDTMIYAKNGCAFPESNRYYPIFEYMFVLSKSSPCSANLIADRKNEHTSKRLSRMERQPNGTERRPERVVRPPDRGVRWNIWMMDVVPNNEAGDHVAPFSEALARDHILSWSNEGDLVLDPFAGSFTTCKMARLLGRRWIGIEINPDYCEIGRKRLAQKLLDFDAAG